MPYAAFALISINMICISIFTISITLSKEVDASVKSALIAEAMNLLAKHYGKPV